MTPCNINVQTLLWLQPCGLKKKKGRKMLVTSKNGILHESDPHNVQNDKQCSVTCNMYHPIKTFKFSFAEKLY